jgi:hypothetical protein
VSTSVDLPESRAQRKAEGDDVISGADANGGLLVHQTSEQSGPQLPPDLQRQIDVSKLSIVSVLANLSTLAPSAFRLWSLLLTIWDSALLQICSWPMFPFVNLLMNTIFVEREGRLSLSCRA